MLNKYTQYSLIANSAFQTLLLYTASTQLNTTLYNNRNIRVTAPHIAKYALF